MIGVHLTFHALFTKMSKNISSFRETPFKKHDFEEFLWSMEDALAIEENIKALIIYKKTCSFVGLKLICLNKIMKV